MFRKKLAIAASVALVAAGLIAAPPAFAEDDPGGIITGNAARECRSAGYDLGVKLNTGDTGTYVYETEGPWEPDGLDLDLEVTINADGTFSWVNNDPPPTIAAILVKAGTQYDVFVIPAGTDSGSGLEPSDKYDISHITFCFGDDDEPRESLKVEKSVYTSYDRTHDWSVTKSADPAEVWLYAPNGNGPGEAEVEWSVDVSYDGYTDSGHMVFGEIVVLNDGPTVAPIADVTDDLSDWADPVAVACESEEGPIDFTLGTYFLEPGDMIGCTYGVEVDSMIGGTNTATATTAGGSYYHTVDVEWGGPTTETNASITATDVSELFPGADKVWNYTAPTGGTETYSNTFAWDEYEECGDYSYDNTVTLTSSEPGVVGRLSATAIDAYLDPIDSASASVDVHVQCQVFQGETAWAANTTAGTLKYNTKKGGNWATYVQYPNTAPVQKVYNLYAGQTHLAGTATVTPVAGGVTVTVDLGGAWEFAGVGSNLKIEKYTSTAPSGNPSPGLFTYKTSCVSDPCTSGVIPLAKFYGIHLDVGVWVPDPNFGP
ncbi:hypothetical protein [Microbacterium sp. 2FI]|uniref:hypothetical protein n=1 Tax=Microbacterium sp. 2FI TaxID=2502193 RepID=UPI0010F843D3|nr:hypothetical protein [Microbacterium sp. 2FI]